MRQATDRAHAEPLVAGLGGGASARGPCSTVLAWQLGALLACLLPQLCPVSVQVAGGAHAQPLGTGLGDGGHAAHAAQPARLPGSSLVPSRGTVIALLVAIHVAALLYWAWVVVRAYRCERLAHRARSVRGRDAGRAALTAVLSLPSVWDRAAMHVFANTAHNMHVICSSCELMKEQRVSYKFGAQMSARHATHDA